MDELIIQQIDQIKKARFFKAIFDRMPTSDDLDIRNTKTPLFTGVNQFFQLLKNKGSPMVRSVDKRWNSLYPDILHLVQGLERLGLEYHNDEVHYGEPKETPNV